MSEKISCLSCDCWDPDAESCAMPGPDREYACPLKTDSDKVTVRCIDANALLIELGAGFMPIFEKGISGMLGDDTCIKDYIDRAPTIKAHTKKCGSWILNGFSGKYYCSKCGFESIWTEDDLDENSYRGEEMRFCSHCGAEMDNV